MSNLVREIARGTIAEILERHGIEPAPERSRKTTWKEFLSRHWELIRGRRVSSVEVWTRAGLEVIENGLGRSELLLLIRLCPKLCPYWRDSALLSANQVFASYW